MILVEIKVHQQSIMHFITVTPEEIQRQKNKANNSQLTFAQLLHQQRNNGSGVRDKIIPGPTIKRNLLQNMWPKSSQYTGLFDEQHMG